MIPALFEPVAQLAFVRVIDRPMHAQMLAWLRGAEAAARRLLLIEALALAPAPGAAPLAPATVMATRTRAKRGPRPDPFASDDPAEWRVSFAMTVSPRQRRRRFSRGPALAWRRRFVSSLGLAARMEALRRVTANPSRFAQRLAARIARAPALIARVLHAFTPTRTDPAGDVFTEADAAAKAALARRDSS
jgi:hypothetical protein